MPGTDANDVDAVIRGRRTSLRMSPDTPVDRATIEELCALACCAPNHHSTAPWRFAVFTGDGRARLGNTIADAMAAQGERDTRVDKTRLKYLRAPAMIVVGVAPGSTTVENEENRDAVAAAIQTLLLAATARGLATFWSSVATPTLPALTDLCGFEPGTVAIAAIYIGHPTETPPAKDLTCPPMTWIGQSDG
jgi:nitroreductase